jgi:sensor histidine kinase regulating citrate/malate metabolism
MEFLDIFSLTDVFIAATGLMFVSILRIYYDSYVEKKKVKRFGNSLELYNITVEDGKEGLLIISNSNEIIFVNTEAAKILNTDKTSLDVNYLNSIGIEYYDTHTNENFMEMVYTKKHIVNAHVVINSYKLAITATVNKVNLTSYENDYCYVVILHDMTLMNDLREKARSFLLV